jgi:RNA polymerase sigma factor (sigma-70 family)
VEASALEAPGRLSRITVPARLLRLRSDEQLVALFRAGSEEAFAAIHDRYRRRLFAYVGQMLPGSRQDAEDALQDVFVRAYAGLRANGRPISLRAWLYRVAHNRCVDQLRRPAPVPADVFDVGRAALHDPLVEAERREDLRRLLADMRALPPQQRSALLMREIDGLSYSELADALAVSVPAVKSLLVRARLGLAQAAEARDTACEVIRAELCLSHDRGVRVSGLARRHLRECETCRAHRADLRTVQRNLAAILPIGVGPATTLAKVFGLGAAGGGTAGGGAATAGGAAAGGGLAAGGGAVSATKLAAVVGCAVVGAGGAVEVKRFVDHPEPVVVRAAPATTAANPAPRAVPPRGVARVAPSTPSVSAVRHTAPPPVPAAGSERTIFRVDEPAPVLAPGAGTSPVGATAPANGGATAAEEEGPGAPGSPAAPGVDTPSSPAPPIGPTTGAETGSSPSASTQATAPSPPPVGAEPRAPGPSGATAG